MQNGVLRIQRPCVSLLVSLRNLSTDVTFMSVAGGQHMVMDALGLHDRLPQHTSKSEGYRSYPKFPVQTHSLCLNYYTCTHFPTSTLLKWATNNRKHRLNDVSQLQ